MQLWWQTLEPALEEFLEGVLDEEGLWEHLERSELEAEEFIQGLHEQLLDRLDEEGLLVLVDPLLEHCQRLYADFDALKVELEESVPEQQLQARKQAFLARAQAIEQSLSRLRQWYEERPKRSKSPFVDEILRIAEGCLQQRQPWESLLMRLEVYGEAVDQFGADFREQELEHGLWGLLLEERRKVEFELQRLEETLAALSLAVVEAEARQGLESELSELKRSSEAILEVRVAAQQRYEQPFGGDVACPRCATQNERREKNCCRCGARLPRDLSQDTGGEVDFHSDRGPTGVPAYILELGGLYGQVLEGSLSPQALQVRLAALLEQARNVGKRLELLPGPPEGAAQELAEALLLARGELRQAQQQWQSILESMAQSAQLGDWTSFPGYLDGLSEAAQVWGKLEARARFVSQSLQPSST